MNDKMRKGHLFGRGLVVNLSAGMAVMAPRILLRERGSSMRKAAVTGSLVAPPQGRQSGGCRGRQPNLILANSTSGTN